MMPAPSRRLLLRPAAGVLIAVLAAVPAPSLDRNVASAPASEAMARVPLEGLVAAIAGWVAAATGLPVPATLPRLVFVDPSAALAAERRALEQGGLHAGVVGSDVIAFYDTRSHTIHLPTDWTGGTVAELSILVHEMVHHLQTLAGERFACPAAREKPAIEAQERWLESFGESLEGAIGIDRLTVIVATNCLMP